MPTHHLHISTGFMFVIAFFVFGIVALVLHLRAIKRRAEAEERVALAAIAAEASRPRTVPSVGSKDSYTFPSVPVYPAYENRRPGNQPWGTPSTQPGGYTPTGYPVAPAPVAAPTSNNDMLTGVLVGGLAGAALGHSVGSNHGSSGHSSHTESVSNSYYSSPSSESSGFSYSDSSPSSSDSGGFDLSW